MLPLPPVQLRPPACLDLLAQLEAAPGPDQFKHRILYNPKGDVKKTKSAFWEGGWRKSKTFHLGFYGWELNITVSCYSGISDGTLQVTVLLLALCLSAALLPWTLASKVFKSLQSLLLVLLLPISILTDFHLHNLLGSSWINERRRQWHSTPVLLPGKSHGWRSLVGCSPWGRWELDTTERLHFHFSLSCIGEGNGNPVQCNKPSLPLVSFNLIFASFLSLPGRHLLKNYHSMCTYAHFPLWLLNFMSRLWRHPPHPEKINSNTEP